MLESDNVAIRTLSITKYVPSRLFRSNYLSYCTVKFAFYSASFLIIDSVTKNMRNISNQSFGLLFFFHSSTYLLDIQSSKVHCKDSSPSLYKLVVFCIVESEMITSTETTANMNEWYFLVLREITCMVVLRSIFVLHSPLLNVLWPYHSTITASTPSKLSTIQIRALLRCFILSLSSNVDSVFRARSHFCLGNTS